jgi:hypothetical protein
VVKDGVVFPFFHSLYGLTEKHSPMISFMFQLTRSKVTFHFPIWAIPPCHKLCSTPRSGLYTKPGAQIFIGNGIDNFAETERGVVFHSHSLSQHGHPSAFAQCPVADREAGQSLSCAYLDPEDRTTRVEGRVCGLCDVHHFPAHSGSSASRIEFFAAAACRNWADCDDIFCTDLLFLSCYIDSTTLTTNRKSKHPLKDTARSVR